MRTKPVTRKYTNVSTEYEFQFVFHCDRCGARAMSEKLKFRTERYAPPPLGRTRAFLWTRQHDAAYERANNEAKFEFNVCPVCGRRVCSDCFYVSPGTDTDVCLDCRSSRKP